jgi:hypothetical protein
LLTARKNAYARRNPHDHAPHRARRLAQRPEAGGAEHEGPSAPPLQYFGRFPTYQSATLGVAAISGSRDYLLGLMQQVEAAAAQMALDLGAEIVDAGCEFVD